MTERGVRLEGPICLRRRTQAGARRERAGVR